MIIYGSKNKQLASENIYEKCPECGTTNSTDMHVFQKYAHIYWLPLFPLGMHGASQCDHCKVIFKNNKMPNDLRLAYYNVRAKAKTPIWMFTGLILIGCLVTFGVYGSYKEEESTKKYISDLRVNDILEIKVSEGYTTIKVTAVIGDSVFYRSNQYAADRKSGLTKINNEDKSFYEETEASTKKEMQTKFDNKEILTVKRK
jgi:hypothetical protein